jgi:hypothetical protein
MLEIQDGTVPRTGRSSRLVSLSRVQNPNWYGDGFITDCTDILFNRREADA